MSIFAKVRAAATDAFRFPRLPPREERVGERRASAAGSNPAPRPSSRSCLAGRGRRTCCSLRQLPHDLTQRLIRPAIRVPRVPPASERPPFGSTGPGRGREVLRATDSNPAPDASPPHRRPQISVFWLSRRPFRKLGWGDDGAGRKDFSGPRLIWPEKVLPTGTLLSRNYAVGNCEMTTETR